MVSNGIEIVVGVTNRSYRMIGPIKARVGAITVFSPEPDFQAALKVVTATYKQATKVSLNF